MRFYLGTHKPGWLEHLEVPLFISRRRLAERVGLPRARAPWALDSGAFTELESGAWELPVDTYVEEVHRYATEIGRLEWAAPMDWPCAPPALAGTGLSVLEHVDRTVANYLELRGRGPFVPVLQGWAPVDYLACLELYAQAGVALEEEPVVALGSIAARQDTGRVAGLVRELESGGIRLHGLGVKVQGLALYGQHLTSADSTAWSYHARNRPPLPGCEHASCANCPRYALKWREELLAAPLGRTEAGIQHELGACA